MDSFSPTWTQWLMKNSKKKNQNLQEKYEQVPWNKTYANEYGIWTQIYGKSKERIIVLKEKEGKKDPRCLFF